MITPVSPVAYIALSANKIWIEVPLCQHFSFTNPNFDTDLTINSQCKYIGVIDIHTESMQGHTSLFDLFGTGNFSAAQTTTHFYFYSFGTHTKRRSDCHFNGS